MIFPDIDSKKTIQKTKNQIDAIRELYQLRAYEITEHISYIGVKKLNVYEKTKFNFKTKYDDLNMQIIKAFDYLDEQPKYIILKYCVEYISLTDIKNGINCDFSISKVYEQFPKILLSIAYLVKDLIVYQDEEEEEMLTDLGLMPDEHMETLLDLTHSKKIEMIKLSQIQPNPFNLDLDTEEEIQHFAEEVYEQGGIREPLHCYLDEEYNKYILLAGHKRYNACLINREKYSDAQSIVPVIVEEKPSDPIKERLMIEELNQNRNYDDKKLLIRSRRLHTIYLALEERGEKPKGEKRKWFAKKLCCGEKKAERLIHIIEGRYSPNETKLKNAPNRQFEDVRTHMQHKLKTKIKITNNSITISYHGIDDFNRVLELIGCGEVVNE